MSESDSPADTDPELTAPGHPLGDIDLDLDADEIEDATPADRSGDEPLSIDPVLIDDDLIEVDDGKMYAPLDALTPWAKNPRTASDKERERVGDQLENLGQYKPLIVLADGTIIGGNMRSAVMEDREWERAWVEVIDPDNKSQLIEYALSDNDRAGHYDEDEMAALISRHRIDLSNYKVDFYRPQDLSQNLVRSVDPDQLIRDAGGPDAADDAIAATERRNETTPEEVSGEASGTDTETGSEAEADDGPTVPDPSPSPGAEAGEQDHSDADHPPTDSAPARTGSFDSRSDDKPDPSERKSLGNQASTAMVQLIMSRGEKSIMMQQVKRLKKVYDVDTTTDVVQIAVERAFVSRQERREASQGDSPADDTDDDSAELYAAEKTGADLLDQAGQTPPDPGPEAEDTEAEPDAEPAADDVEAEAEADD